VDELDELFFLLTDTPTMIAMMRIRRKTPTPIPIRRISFRSHEDGHFTYISIFFSASSLRLRPQTSTLAQLSDTHSSTFAAAAHIHHPQVVVRSRPSAFSSFLDNDCGLLLPLAVAVAPAVLPPVLPVLEPHRRLGPLRDTVLVSAVVAHFFLASG